MYTILPVIATSLISVLCFLWRVLMAEDFRKLEDSLITTSIKISHHIYTNSFECPISTSDLSSNLNRKLHQFKNGPNHF